MGTAKFLPLTLMRYSRAFERIFYQDVLYAVEHYASLMVVTAATNIENIFLEFFTAFFISNPSAMHAHLMPDTSAKAAPSVPLREVLSASRGMTTSLCQPSPVQI